MLSAFQAQPIHELKQRDKSKIESLLTYGDRLLVGLNNGALRIYRVNEPSQQEETTSAVVEDGDNPPTPQASPSKSKQKFVELLREEEKFSKRPVQQLAIIKEVNVLVSLSDGHVSLHDLQSYQLVEKLERTKGATCFSVTSNVVKDTDTGVPTLVSRLAVGVKRRVLCWVWQDMEQLPDVSETGLEASIKCLTWVTGTKLVAGMDPGFSLVDIETQEITQINKPGTRTSSDNMSTAELAGVRFGAVTSSGMGYMGMGSWVPKPMVTPLSSDQVLLAKDVNTLFISATSGSALEKRQVPWSSAPEAIGYSYPYLLALQAPEKGTLQIRNPDTLSLLQTIAVPGATILHVPPPNISLAHAGKRFLVASERVIWRMNALSYDDALAELVAAERFDEAISLLSLLEDTLIEDKMERIREIKIQKATALFRERQYRASLDLFTEAEAPPLRVVALYPREIAGEVSSVPAKEEDMADSGAAKDGHEDGDKVLDTNTAVKEPPSTPGRGLLGRVTGGHSRKDSDTDSIKSASRIEAPPSPSPSHKRTPSKQQAPTSTPAVEKDKPLEGEDLKFAVRCLTSFLAQARVKIQKYLDPDGTLKENPPTFDKETGKPEFANLLPQSVFSTSKTDGGSEIDWEVELFQTAQLVYTTLFRAYMLVSPSLAGSLFRIDNFCDPEVVQASLYANHRYNDLIDFLHGKKLHRQALEILAKFGKEGGQVEGDEEVGEDDVPEGMRGPERTVAYLKQLPPDLIDLILEFAAWPVREKPEVGMEVFLADTDFAERLPRERVRKFLAEIDQKLEVWYLEHVINELGDGTGEFHQGLVDIYIEEMKGRDLDRGEKEPVREKLEAFLRKSKEYNKAKTFRQLPADDEMFFEVRAIVLAAMGNHKQALAIYVIQLKDYDKAEAYCNKVYQTEMEAEQQQQQQQHARPATSRTTTSDIDRDGNTKPSLQRAQTEVSKDRPNIFATLLGLYLRPPPPEEKRWPQALDLLSRHGARLPASSTLEFMPDDLAVQELQNYFRGRLRHATSLSRQEKIIKNLEGVRLANTEFQLVFGSEAEIEKGRLGGRSRRVRIAEEDHCRVCHRRFGASAVKVLTDGEVVHYGCAGKKGGEGLVKAGGGRGWG